MSLKVYVTLIIHNKGSADIIKLLQNESMHLSMCFGNNIYNKRHQSALYRFHHN